MADTVHEHPPAAKPESLNSPELHIDSSSLGSVKARLFGRESRLRTRKHFLQVRSRGRNRPGKFTVLQVAIPPPDGQQRFATVVSKRYSKRAVDRNRARRLLREAYRLLHPELKKAWIVLIPRWRMRQAKLGDILPEIRELCQAAGLLKEDEPQTGL